MWHSVLLGWAATRRPLRPVHTFSMNASLCEKVLPHFYEDTFLSWQRFTCDDVQAAVRRGFDTWSYNSMLSFREVTHSADIDIGAQVLEDAQMLAYWHTREFQEARIVFSSGMCWYTDAAYCAQAHQTFGWVVTLLVAVWGVSLAGVFLLLRYNPVRKVDPVVRLVVWSVFFCIPLSAFGTLAPCFLCYDFESTVVHEVGHAIGFSHSGDASVSHRCGCGEGAVHCSTTPSPRESIMFESHLVRPHACLSRDDADGVRSLYGGDCDDPVWCYATTSFAGFTRLSISFVYSFLGAWVAVFARNSYERWKWGRRRARVSLPVVQTTLAARPAGTGSAASAGSTGSAGSAAAPSDVHLQSLPVRFSQRRPPPPPP